MSTQAHRGARHPVRSARLDLVVGLLLYLLTLAAELGLAAAVRWPLVYLGVALARLFLPFSTEPAQLAWAGVFGPVCWSLLGLLLPGRASLWRLHLGARRPSTEEGEAIADAMGQLRQVDPTLPDPSRFLVIDDPIPTAAVRGLTVLLGRAVIELDSLPAVLAHELGHADSLDGRLTEALQRLSFWDDSLVPGEFANGEPDHAVAERGGAIWGLARWALRLAGGGEARQVLRPIWGAYWRRREYAADEYAASLGQAEDLARHLADFELPFDPPQRRFIFNRAEHPPVAHRIECLLCGHWGSSCA
jgi:hypothetical protein